MVDYSSVLGAKNMVDIAQVVRVSGCGPEGRGFESHYPPHKKRSHVSGGVFVWRAIWDENSMAAAGFFLL